MTKTEIHELYVTLFNRAAENSGVTYWQGLGLDAKATAGAMLDVKESQDYFKANNALNDNKAFAETIYKNLFGKDYSQDKAGIDYWVNELNKEGAKKGDIIVDMLNAAKQYAGSADPAEKAAYDTFANKVAISEYVATKAENLDNKFTFNKMVELLKGTTDSNLDEQKAKVDALAEPGSVPGDTIELTADVDNVEGTANDDTIKAKVYLGNGLKESTLIAADNVDAKEGNDTLDLSILLNNWGNGANFAGTDLTSALTGVKNVESLKLAIGVAAAGAENITPVVETFTEELNISSVDNVQVTNSNAKKVVLNQKGAASDWTLATAPNATYLEVKQNVAFTAGITAGKAETVKLDAGNVANDFKSGTHSFTEAKEVVLKNGKVDAVTTFVKASKIVADNVDVANAIGSSEKKVDLTLKNVKGDAASTAFANATDLAVHVEGNEKLTLTDGSTKFENITVDGKTNLTFDVSAATALKKT